MRYWYLGTILKEGEFFEKKKNTDQSKTKQKQTNINQTELTNEKHKIKLKKLSFAFCVKFSVIYGHLLEVEKIPFHKVQLIKF